MQDFQTELEHGMEYITPTLAQKYLDETNTDNYRLLRPSSVRKWARKMSEGKWIANPQSPLTWDTNGILQEGQHRLHGVVESGETVPFYTLRGVDPAVVNVMGSELTRNSGDALRREGFPYYKIIAQGVRLISQARDNWVSQGYDAPFVLDFALDHQDDLVHAAGLAESIKALINLSPGITTAVLFEASQLYGWEETNEFAEQLRTGANLKEKDPILTLRTTVLRNNNSPRKLSNKEMYGMVIRTWNRWIRNEPLTQLKARRASNGRGKGKTISESFPVIQ